MTMVKVKAKAKLFLVLLVFGFKLSLGLGLTPISAVAQFIPSPAQQIPLISTNTPTASVAVSYTGAQGSDTYCYFVVATFTAGQSPLSPTACVSNASTLSASNAITVSWSQVPNAAQYYLLRTNSANFSGSCANCLLAGPTAIRTFTDTGSVVPGAFNLTGVIPQRTGTIYLDTLNYATARMMLNPQIGPNSIGPGTPLSTNVLTGLGWQPITSVGANATSIDGVPVTVTGLAANQILITNSANTAYVNRGLLTAIGGLIGTNNRIPYVSGGALTSSASLTFDGTYFKPGAMELGVARFTAAGGVVTITDPTAGTGLMRLIVQAGAGQSGNILEVLDNGGGTLATINASGAITAANVINAAAGYYVSGSNWFIRNTSTGGNAVTVNNSWQVGSIGAFRFTDGDYRTGTPDIDIYRVSAGVLGVGVGDKGVSGLGQINARAMRANPGATARPTCDSAARGTYWQTYGGAGVADTVAVCAKDAGDAYDWRAIY